VTTGFGDLYSAEGKDYWYTSTFDGTSSASPVVAGAVACCAGFWKASVTTRFPLDYIHIRNVLTSTGTLQITPPTGNIGPRPDLRAAFARLVEWRDATTSPLETGDYPPAWGDYDGDGDEDLYVPNRYPNANRLLRNNGVGVFTDVTPDLLRLSSYDSYSAAWGDYDNDGDLDLYVENYGTGNCRLFRQDAGGWVNATSGPLSGWSAGSTPMPSWVDYDNDGDIDLYWRTTTARTVSAQRRGRHVRRCHHRARGRHGSRHAGSLGGLRQRWGPGCLHRQLQWVEPPPPQRRRLFVDVTTPALGVYDGGLCCWGDYDNDCDLDLYVTTATYGSANKLFRNDGGSFVDVAAGAITGLDHDGKVGWLDADNDGISISTLSTTTRGTTCSRTTAPARSRRIPTPSLFGRGT